MKASSKVWAVANFCKRLSSLLSIAIGAVFGYCIGEIVFAWLWCSFPGGGTGSLWGSRIAAAIAIWKSAISATESAISAWWYIKQRSADFNHTKALFGAATIVFGIVLGFRTFTPGNKPNVPLPELMCIVSHQGRVAPSFIVAPALLFRSAGLRNPDVKSFSAKTKISADFFVDGSVSLTNGQDKSISRLAAKLGSEYIYDGPETLLVYGFANDRPILDGKMQPRQDSDFLNLAIANLRGESLYEALRRSFADLCPDDSVKVSIVWEPWDSLGEMRYFRNEVFRNLHIAPSSLIDHRSAVLVISNPRTSAQLDSLRGR